MTLPASDNPNLNLLGGIDTRLYLNDVMQVFSFTECFDWTSTEEFSEEVVFPAFKTPPQCSVHGNVNGRLQGRFLLLTRRQSIRLEYIM